MTTAKDALKMIKDNDVKYVDFRFTDPRGKWQHVTFDRSMIEEETFAEGQMFDGSSIAGWKAIHESDMNLMPDPAMSGKVVTITGQNFGDKPGKVTIAAGLPLRLRRVSPARVLSGVGQLTPRPARWSMRLRKNGRSAAATRFS